MTTPRSLHTEFVVLNPDKHASIEHADAALYQRLDSNYGNFAGHELISCHAFSSDWPGWEAHPHGDEIVVLLAGATTFHLQTDAGEITVDLTEQGQYVLVPQGVWHTARTPVHATLLFITPGQDTRHKLPPADR